MCSIRNKCNIISIDILKIIQKYIPLLIVIDYIYNTFTETNMFLIQWTTIYLLIHFVVTFIYHVLFILMVKIFKKYFYKIEKCVTKLSRMQNKYIF